MSRRKPETMHVVTNPLDLKKPLDFLGLERAVTRNAGTVIKDPFAILVLRFIADRTFGWSKDAEFISAGQFLNGIVTRAGDLVCAGLPIGRSKLYTCIAALKEAGAILVETVRGRTRYSIKREFVMGLKIPNRLKASGEQKPEVLTSDDLGNDFGGNRADAAVHHMDLGGTGPVHAADGKESPPIRIEQENRGEAVASRYADPGLCEQETQKAGTEFDRDLAAGKARQEVQTAKRAKRAAEHNAAALFNAFADVARATWPDMRVIDPPKDKQVWQLRALSRAWAHPDVTFQGFLEWCAANWRGVWASKFVHVDTKDPKFRYSDHPDIGTLIYFNKAFRDAYDRRGSQKIRAGLTRRDNLIRERMFKGFSQADAEREADEILGREKVREDLDERARKVNEAARRLEAREQDLDTRVALGKARLAEEEARRAKAKAEGRVQPVSLTKDALKPDWSHGIGPIPRRPTPEWKDDLDA